LKPFFVTSIVDRFHQAERDILLVPETHIDLRTNPYETDD